MNSEDIKRAAEIFRNAKRIAVLTGAGISAESGVPTFRGKDGLWRQFRAEDLATPEAFSRDPKLVWEWYNWRRGLVGKVEPNPAHQTLAKWETVFPEFALITQNVDGLHVKAGSKNILELHGNIWKLRCTKEETVTENHASPLGEIPPRCPACGEMLRPHVVWFGEALDPNILHRAFSLCSLCEVMLVIGTSAFVQPAASLPLYASDAGAKIIEINPDPTPLTSYANLFLQGKAGEILPLIDQYLGTI
ncbi:MAG: NAD-dependent deacylase [Candidatus Aminicenantes bacterium]|jgi:NAD-dependent deacetylase|nr:NAD-dependent deacylase [Candidatus Aminicenantes bacterium]